MTDAQARLAAALSDRYRIEREIGAGGMATVYLAEDLKHHRQVAIKVLRPELAAMVGAERFLSEIRTTANLQHPHILPLFDSGIASLTTHDSRLTDSLTTHDSRLLFYVMPFIEGESLRDCLAREKQLPIDDAVRIATEVAGALDYAHRHGVIHRDIKPENILLHDGRALVADFGIALAASRAGGARMTETGMNLGTPHYMSPEQAMGDREITARSDVYALGCVLYEMLTGETPFTGSTAQAIVARVVTESPRLMIPQRHTIPPQVEAAVLTALEKLPADRFASAKDFADALARPHVLTSSRPEVSPPYVLTSSRRATALPVLAVVTVLSLLAAAWGWRRARALADPPTTWQYISLGDSVSVSPRAPSLTLSPDGTTLVLKDDTPEGLLWAKHADALSPVVIAGTERASSPVFSPDGEWIAFIADQKLRKVRLAGGAVVTLADSAAGSAGGFGGVTWLEDGSLVYVSPDFNRLLRVSASGGASTVLLNNPGLQGLGFNYPTALPGARGVLVQVCNSGCGIMSLRVFDLRTGTLKLLLNEVAQAWYLPTGHILYVRREGAALVAPFDLNRLELTGPAIAVLDRVVVARGFAQLSASPSGSVIYAKGEGANDENTVVRVARDGTIAPIDSAWTGRFSSVAIAPDGRRLAVGAGTGTGGLNIWIKQLDRGPFTRLSFGGSDRRPVWSPDGRMVAFVRDTLGTGIVAARLADGSRPDTVLVRLSQQVQEADWSRDGRWLVLRTDNGGEGAGDLIGVRVNGDTTPVMLVGSPFTELNPAISPDGRWLAYASNESGRNEVYVRPFPATGDGRWQASTSGGIQPRWSPDSRELYYLNATSQLIAARITTSPGFAITELQPLFDASRLSLDPFHQSYDVMADGRGFIFAAPAGQGATTRAPSLVRVDHWFRDLRARLAEH